MSRGRGRRPPPKRAAKPPPAPRPPPPPRVDVDPLDDVPRLYVSTDLMLEGE